MVVDLIVLPFIIKDVPGISYSKRYRNKRYEEETNLRCQIILDTSSSMYYPNYENLSLENPNKILFSVYATAVLMNLLKRQRAFFAFFYTNFNRKYLEKVTSNLRNLTIF